MSGKPFDAIFDAAEMKPVPPYESADGLPTVTHEGVVTIMGATFRVYQLSSGQRVLNGEDVERFIGGIAL